MKKHLFLKIMMGVFLLVGGVAASYLHASDTISHSPLVYRALLAQAGAADPYLLVEYENTLGPVSFEREQAGVYSLRFDNPVLPIEPIPWVNVSIYDDGVATQELIEASPEDEYIVRFTHYQKVGTVFVLSDGYKGSFGLYIEILVYP